MRISLRTVQSLAELAEELSGGVFRLTSHTEAEFRVHDGTDEISISRLHQKGTRLAAAYFYGVLRSYTGSDQPLLKLDVSDDSLFMNRPNEIHTALASVRDGGSTVVDYMWRGQNDADQAQKAGLPSSPDTVASTPGPTSAARMTSAKSLPEKNWRILQQIAGNSVGIDPADIGTALKWAGDNIARGLDVVYDPDQDEFVLGLADLDMWRLKDLHDRCWQQLSR